MSMCPVKRPRGVLLLNRVCTVQCYGMRPISGADVPMLGKRAKLDVSRRAVQIAKQHLNNSVDVMQERDERVYVCRLSCDP